MSGLGRPTTLVVLFRLLCINKILFFIIINCCHIVSLNTFKVFFFLRAQSREVVGSNPTSDMIGIFLRPAPTQGEFDTGSMGGSSH